MGSSLVTLMVNWTEFVNPESNPAPVPADVLAVRYVHGSAKEDWVTEWGIEPPGKKKVTSVPTGAVILAGLNVKVLLGATLMFMWPVVFARAEGAETAAALVVVPEAGGAPPYC